MDEKDLKIAALKEALGKAVSDYEDRIADLRVEITLLSQQNEPQKPSPEREFSEPTDVPRAQAN